MLGNLLERVGKADEARALYDAYAKANPGTMLLVPLYARLDAGTKPNPIVATAIDGAAEAIFNIANTLRQQRARETAMVLGRLALWLKPTFPIAQMMVADILDGDDRYEDDGYDSDGRPIRRGSRKGRRNSSYRSRRRSSHMSGNGGDLQMDPQKVVRMLSLMDQMDQHLARTVAKQKAQRRRAKLQRKKRKEKQKAKRAKIRQLLSAEKGDGGGTAALVALSILSGSASSSS